MTKQEAIKILNKYDLNFCDIDGNPIPPQDLAEAFDMAIEALQHEQERREDIYECPNCLGEVHINYIYCPFCGIKVESDEQ